MSEYSLEATPLGSVCHFEFRLDDVLLYRLTVRADGMWWESADPQTGFGAAAMVRDGYFGARLHNGRDRREWHGPVPEKAAVFTGKLPVG